MSDYVKLFNTILERDNYENSASFTLPYVSLVEATGDVNFIPEGIIKEKQDAEVGDIVLTGNFIVSPSDYTKIINWRKPIGIVGIAPNILPDKKMRIISIDYMSTESPSTGSKTPLPIAWGESSESSIYYTHFPLVSTIENSHTLTENTQRINLLACIPTDYLPTNNLESTTKGYYYYSAIADNIPAPCAYLSDGTLNPIFINNEFTVPNTSTIATFNNAFSDFVGNNTQHCSAYNVGKLCWKMPSVGELAAIISKLNIINTTRLLIAGEEYEMSTYWTSTVSFALSAMCIDFTTATVKSNYKETEEYYILAVSTI